MNSLNPFQRVLSRGMSHSSSVHPSPARSLLGGLFGFTFPCGRMGIPRATRWKVKRHCCHATDSGPNSDSAGLEMLRGGIGRPTALPSFSWQGTAGGFQCRIAYISCVKSAEGQNSVAGRRNLIAWKSLTVSFCILLLFTSSALAATNQRDWNHVKHNFLLGNYEEVVSYGAPFQVRADDRGSLEMAYYVAVAYFQTGNYEAGRQKLLAIKGEAPRVNFMDQVDLKLADSYFMEGNYSKAFELYQAIPQNHPKCPYLPVVYKKMAESAQKLGRFEEAQKYRDQLKSQFPLSTEAQQAAENELRPLPSQPFAVQVGSFYNPRNANRMYSDLVQKGYSTRIEKTTKAGLAFYRVQTSGYATRSEAEEAAQKLRLDGYQTKIIP